MASVSVGDRVEILVGGIWYQEVHPTWVRQVGGSGPYIIERIEGNTVYFAGLNAVWDLAKVRRI